MFYVLDGKDNANLSQNEIKITFCLLGISSAKHFFIKPHIRYKETHDHKIE